MACCAGPSSDRKTEKNLTKGNAGLLPSGDQNNRVRCLYRLLKAGEIYKKKPQDTEFDSLNRQTLNVIFGALVSKYNLTGKLKSLQYWPGIL